MLAGGIAGGISTNRAAKKQIAAGKGMASAGAAEAKKALNFKRRNPFKIPAEAKTNVDFATNELGSSALQEQMMQQADRSLASASGAINRTSTSSSDAQAMLMKLYGQSQEGYNNALMVGAEERQRDIGNYMNANNQMADYRGIQYDQNVNMPFLQRMELAQGKVGGGMNMMGAASQARVESAGMIGHAISGAGQVVGGLYSAGAFSGGGGGSTAGSGGGMR
jgi:hypothetical protein